MALWTQIRSTRGVSLQISWGKQVASVLLYATAIPAAWFRPSASLALIAIVALLWMLPPKPTLRGK
jgi:hypothetical protein